MLLVLSTPSSQLRDWGLFLLAAALPAVVVGLLGLRALRNEEAALRRELLSQAEATALALEQRVAERLAALEKGEPPDAVPWAEAVKVDAATLQAAGDDPVADTTAVGSTPARTDSKRCGDLADTLRTAAGEPWTQAATAILADCGEATTSRGRSLWPLVALDPRVAIDAERLGTWLDHQVGRLDAVEREVIRREIEAATWLEAPAKEKLMGRLETMAMERTAPLIAQHRYAMQLGGSPVQWSDRRSVGRLDRQSNGDYTGTIVHVGSLVAAMNAGWPALPEGFEARLSRSGGEPAFPIQHEAQLFGDLRLAVGHPRPDRLAQRSKRLLGAAAAGSALLAVALAALLFARMRRARQLGALRTDFVTAVSHELRTPIASLRMLAELLAEDRIEERERAEVHQALAREAKRLGATVDRLLGFSRMEAGRARIEAEPTDLRALTEDAIATFEARFPETGPVTRRLPEGELFANVDPQAVQMVLENLLGNARKYAPDGAPYEVGLRHTDGGVELTVTDHGPGIAKRHQRRIFRPFERADDRLSEATEGSGIGLSLVSFVARSHGGRASVRSELGRGATFIVWLPIKTIGASTETET